MANDPYNLDPANAAPGGMINAAAAPTSPDKSVTGYTAAQAAPIAATSTGYTPKGVVVADDQTVAGNLKGIIDQESPLMQQAETRARIAANNRGLINSSIAVGAGQDAVTAAALPIAQQDATTRYNANAKTVDAQNAALNFEAQAGNQASIANAQLGTDVAKNNAGMINAASAQSAQAANTLQLGYLDQETRTKLQTLDNQTKMSLATLDAQNRQLLQANQGAANMFQQTVTAIGNISINPSLSKEAKDAAVASQIALLREGLKQQGDVAGTLPAEVAGLNLGQYFLPDGPAANPPPPATTAPLPGGALSAPTDKPVPSPYGSFAGVDGLLFMTEEEAQRSYTISPY